ncbi:hypothetical protein [Nostoc sp.]|uniref:hypothetical protein n=1 Tax=Nostoc sp. TaxID=1180 RepID=UPI0035940C4B
MTDSENYFEEIVQKMNYIIDKVCQLDRRLVAVEKSLEQIHNFNYIDSGRKITEAMETPTITKVDLSESELIEVYNHDFQELASNAIKVSVTLDSLLTGNNDVVLLEKTKNASYWILVAQDDTHWLLPKGNLRINTYNYKTVESLFKCNAYQAYASSKFTLNQLAKVELTPNGQQWILVERGVLQFITTDFEEPEEVEVKNFDEITFDDSDSDITLEELNPIFQHPQVHQEVIFSAIELLISAYNVERNLFSTIYPVIEVLETEDSINRRLFDNIDNRQVVFIEVRLGHYWIVTLERVSYLVPKLNIIINSDNLEIVQALFECQDYQDEHSDTFTLIKPAKVSPVFEGQNWVLLTSVEKWILVERGVLQFTY